MRISITHPEIAALREAVEIRFGTGIHTPRHFIALSQDICDSVREYLSETTLQRLWQYKKGYKTVAVHSLNVLSRYCGFSDWGAFCRHLHDDAQVESALFRGKSLDIDTLAPGALIRICWRPDRECIIRYWGDIASKRLKRTMPNWPRATVSPATTCNLDGKHNWTIWSAATPI